MKWIMEPFIKESGPKKDLESARELKYGKMEVNTLDTGKTTKPTVKGD